MNNNGKVVRLHLIKGGYNAYQIMEDKAKAILRNVAQNYLIKIAYLMKQNAVS